MTPKLFTDLGLSPEMLKAISRLGFEQASPIQAEAIPLLLQGRDVIGQSQTGSGKTAAFGIPAIERIEADKPGPQVLVLCPTRELAVQVSEEVHKLVFFKRGIRALPIYGGQSYDRQYAGLRAGAQVVIGTPGRLMDHLERGTLNLANIRTVILDEADEMLDMGFRDDIEFILQRVPSERQTVLFSATIPRPIEELIQRYTRDPQRVRIEAKALTVPTVEQVYYEVDRRWKFEALTRLIEIHDVKLGIIFCNTQRMVDELTEHLNAGGYSADAIHGGMAQAGRDRVMGRFRKGGLEFLVATDVAARGIDVEGIEVVFNFDMPYDAEDYVHRIGRTGRAGRTGMAVSFVSGREVFAIRQIERYTGHRMRRGRVPSEPEIEQAKVHQLLRRVRGTLEEANFRHYDHLIEALLEEGVDSMDLINALFHRLTLGDPELPAEPKARSKAAWPTDAGQPPAAPGAPAATTRPPTRGRPTPAAAAATSAAEPVPSPEPPAEAPAPAPAPVRPKPAPKRFDAPPAPPKFVRKSRDLDQPAPYERRAPHDEPPSDYAPRPYPDRERAKPAPRHRDDRTPPPPFAPRERAGEPVRRPERAPQYPPPSTQRRVRDEAPAAPPAPVGPMARLWVNVGANQGVTPAHVVGCILGETGLPSTTVGRVEIQADHALVEVAGQHSRAILSRLNRAQLAGRRLKARLDS